MTIAQRIKKLANKIRTELDEMTFFTSVQVKKYVESLAKTITGRDVNIHIPDHNCPCETAMTDGDDVVINWQSELLNFFGSLVDRFTAFLGLLFHELAHILYNDFDESRLAESKLENGKTYGDDPVLSDETVWQEVTDAIKEENTRLIFVMLYHALSNIVMDQHDEEKMIDEFGGIPKQCILKIREALRANGHTLEESEKEIQDGENTKLCVLENLMLEYIRFGRVLCETEESEEDSEILQTLYSVSSHIEMARWTDSVKIRYSELNYVVAAMWPVIKEELQDEDEEEDDEEENQQNDFEEETQQIGGSQLGPQNQESGGQPQSQPQGQQQGPQQNQPQGQSQGQQQSQPQGQQKSQPQNSQGQPQKQPSQEKVQSVLDQLSKAEQEAPMTQQPKGKTSKEAKKAAKEAEKGKQEKPQASPQNGNAEVQKSITDAAEQILNDMAEEMAASQLEEEATKDMKAQVVVAINESSTHKGVPIQFSRPKSITPNILDEYDQIMQEVGPYSKRLQKAILAALRDTQLGMVNRHKSFGRTVMAQDMYRADEQFFANKKRPQDLPDMALCVLVDNSGSMSGEKIEQAIRASVLLYDFAHGINVPICINGHDTIGDQIRYRTFADYDTFCEEEKYRMMLMTAGGCNRDGAALLIAQKHLEDRPEKTKLLIVISDGLPNHTGYGGEEARKDIREIVAKARRKGIEVIGAAIDGDRETIKSIYGDGFLDITNLDTLPKTMTKIVTKRILADI